MVFEWLKAIFRWKKKLPTVGRKGRRKVKRLVKLGKLRKPAARKIAVSDLMTRRFFSVSPSATLDEVVGIFISKNISGAPVLDKKFFIGEISKTDILNLAQKSSLIDLSPEDKKMLSSIRVADVMKKPICIYQTAPIEEAEKMMAKHKIRRLLVLDKRKNLVGIITKTDLVKGKSKEEIKEMVFTKVDDMMAILERKGRETFKSLSIQLEVPESLVENWCKVLEDHGLVEIEYPAIGNPSVKLKV
jgi:CBS domain-containing protein